RVGDVVDGESDVVADEGLPVLEGQVSAVGSRLVERTGVGQVGEVFDVGAVVDLVDVELGILRRGAHGARACQERGGGNGQPQPGAGSGGTGHPTSEGRRGRGPGPETSHSRNVPPCGRVTLPGPNSLLTGTLRPPWLADVVRPPLPLAVLLAVVL